MSAFSNMSLSPSTTSLSAVQGFRRGGNPSLKKTIQNYKSLQHRLETKLEQLLTKREDLNSRAFIVLEESSSSQRETIPDDPQASKQDTHAVPAVEILAASQQDGERSSQGKTLQLKENSPENSNVKLLSPGGLVEQTETYHSDVTSLVSTATNILIESIKLRLSFIREALEKLNALHRENPKLRTPAELAFLRYEEWLASNQRLFELNAQLYDIERLKFELKHKQVMAKKVLKRTKKGEDKTLTGEFMVVAMHADIMVHVPITSHTSYISHTHTLHSYPHTSHSPIHIALPSPSSALSKTSPSFFFGRKENSRRKKSW